MHARIRVSEATVSRGELAIVLIGRSRLVAGSGSIRVEGSRAERAIAAPAAVAMQAAMQQTAGVETGLEIVVSPVGEPGLVTRARLAATGPVAAAHAAAAHAVLPAWVVDRAVPEVEAEVAADAVDDTTPKLRGGNYDTRPH
jgi:hypothetical protein